MKRDSLFCGRTRIRILLLISSAVALNYLDRALLGVAAPRLQSELALSALQMGVLLSAFSWTYFLAQVPAGWALDRFETRTVYSSALCSWSAVTALHATVGGMNSLLGCRMLLGLAESPCFPANNKIVSTWFPRSERARAIAVYTAAEYVGLSFLSPLLYGLCQRFGWRSLFAAAGIIGLVFSIVFLRKFGEPRDHPDLSAEECAHIQDKNPVSEPKRSTPRLTDFVTLFRHRQIWGLCIGQFAVYSTFIFFLTWFPTYLVSARHLSWLKAGFFTSVPYIAAFFGILFAGWWSDRMLRSGVRLTVARKLPVVIGLFGASSVVGANFVDCNVLIVGILSFAFFSQAMSSSGWSALAELVPHQRLGSVGGIFNAAANSAGIVVPIAVGVMVQRTGSFVMALSAVSAVTVVGALSWIFLVGELRPIPSLAHSG